jgi:thymidylate kinase
MVDKEHTCLFHWSHSLDKHTKQLIRPKLQDEHKVFCQRYKNAKSLADANSHYALIRS